MVFTKYYRKAWMKRIIFTSYLVIFGVVVGAIVLKALVPESEYQISVAFNLAGQLVSATGILDSLQFFLSTYAMKTTTSTNKMFLKVWLAAAVLGAIPYPFAVVGWIPLKTYRYVSIAVISIESLLYVWVLFVLYVKINSDNANSILPAKIYYITTFLCRAGIVVGVGLRVGGHSTDVVAGVHYASVITTGLSLLLFSKVVKKQISKIAGQSKRRSSASGIALSPVGSKMRTTSKARRSSFLSRSAAADNIKSTQTGSRIEERKATSKVEEKAPSVAESPFQGGAAV